MSRTIRRKGGRKPWWYPGCTWDFVDGIWTRTRLEGDALRKALNRYHSDRDYHRDAPAPWRRQAWHEFRAGVRQELARYRKDDGHEVQVRRNPRWEWWD